MIRFQESPFTGYGPRTKYNAENADITIAIAVDFNTAGERLTQKCAIGRFIAINPSSSPESAAERIIEFMTRKGAVSINIAGNGIYSWERAGWSQERVNKYFYDTLALVHAARPIESIRSGGQTGADWAGLVAADALGIAGVGYFPKGYIQRNSSRVDFNNTPATLRAQLEKETAVLSEHKKAGQTSPGPS